MAFVLTMMYVAVTLLSPAAFPLALTMLHLNLILGVLVIITAAFSVGESKLASLPDTYLGLGLLFITAFSVLATGWIGGALAEFLDFGPILITFYFVAIVCSSLTRVKILVFVMTAVALFVFSQGVLASAAGNFTSPYIMIETISTGELHRIRGLGMLSDPNDVAQFYVMLIPLLWLRWKKSHYVSNFFLTILPASILAVAIYFTHSRGGALALVAVILFGFKDKLSVAGSAILAGGAMAGLLALNVAGGRGIAEDDGGRVTAWATGLEVMKSHFILGIGPNNFPSYNPTGYTAHNSFILAMAELGVIGYFFWMGMIISAWTGLSRLILINAPKVVVEDDSNLPAHMRFGLSRSSTPAMTRLVKAPAGVPGLLTHSMAGQAPSFATAMPNSSAKWSPSADPYSRNSEGDKQPDPEGLAYAARIIRISLVGLLAAAFFLSRTYAVTLYIMLGMAVSVIKMSVPLPTVNLIALAKKIVLACFLSALFLYLFVRLHGGK